MTRKEQLNKIATGKVAELSNDQISTIYLWTEAMKITEAIATVRGWLLDEIERRNEKLFIKFLDAKTDKDGYKVLAEFAAA